MSESEKYEVLEKIGHGSFGVIRKVRRKEDGQILCRKEINYVRMSHKEREQLHAELSILSTLRHPNIVGYYHREHLKATQDLHLYMEYCGNGDLGKVIKELKVKKQYAEEGFVWSMFAQLVTALYRCHYGVDPPEVGANIMGLSNSPKPKAPAGGVMILHRDLKPENVFLGADNSVKLGDFGLSKIMQSHDFASTYVGTPFYMSPEICAAERYTLKSDVWSLGCIIYELCSRQPPFNAKTHFELVQKIKEGKIVPIPSVYSPELMAVIRDCLRVNPDRRPDTATLLNLPVVKLMRKEKEVVELGKLLKIKEDLANKKLLDAEEKLKHSEAELSRMREELEASLRREWEVKARLEIDRLVQVEIERLHTRFDQEIQERIDAELAKRAGARNVTVADDFVSSVAQSDIPFSSVSTSNETDFPSTTDFTEYTMESPEPTKALKRSTRTPFTRAHTMFAITPMDVEMADPSPMSIASLSLSPRRNGGKALRTGRDIFATVGERWRPTTLELDSEDEDVPPVPSPTQNISSKNPFRTAAGGPSLVSQKTAPALTFPEQQQNNIFGAIAATKAAGIKDKATSPNRRLSKIPSITNLHGNSDGSSPTRKPSLTRKSVASSDPGDLGKLAIKNNMAMKAANINMTMAPKGRTLVELAQARAGGRTAENKEDETSPKRKTMPAREAPVWDPERDEMPSPFLVRTRKRV